ncbi:MAG: SDR family oxidoreductase [candidate division Zixibacteria bacterium]|nr:SDR family oxidoreductase [candidate division Zixibacteria bacterium]
MTKLLSGKIAIVTGASSGIGKGIAKVFAREGANVVFTYRSNKAGADETAEELKQFGGDVVGIQADIENVEDIDCLLTQTTEKFGKLDVMVNNAGVTSKYDFLDVTEEQFDKLFNINCRGTFFCTQRAARWMKTSGGGSIINISSLSSRASTEGFSVYAATKAAINKFTETAAIELAPENIRVNSIAAGWVPVGEELNRSQHEIEKCLYHIPIGRFGSAEDIGEICAFVASDRAGFITGTTLYSDGGQSCLLSIPSKKRKKRNFQ